MSTNRLVKSEGKLASLLLLPSLIILLLIAVYPLFNVVVTSFTNRTFASARPTEFVGTDNYSRLLSLKIVRLMPITDDTGQILRDENNEVLYEDPLDILPRRPIRYRELNQFQFFGRRYVLSATDPAFIRAIVDTVRFTVISVSLETVLGIMIALVLAKNFKGRGMMRVAMLVPWAIPTAVSSRMWEWMFASSRVGFFNVLGQWLGLSDGQFSFLTESSSQLWAMVAIDVWKTTPFMALLLLAGLQMIDRSIYEAAYVDGCNKWMQFWRITLPNLVPTLVVALIFRTLDALRVFDLFQIVFAQRRYSMASFAYYQLIDNKAMGYSSASSMVIFALILVFIFLYIKTSGVLKDE